MLAPCFISCMPSLFPFNMVEGTWKYQKQKPRSQRNRPENLWRPKKTKQKGLMETTKQILLWLLLLKPRRNERLALQRDLERPWLPKGSAAGASEFWKFSNRWCSRREIYLKIYVILESSLAIAVVYSNIRELMNICWPLVCGPNPGWPLSRSHRSWAWRGENNTIAGSNDLRVRGAPLKKTNILWPLGFKGSAPSSLQCGRIW